MGCLATRMWRLPNPGPGVFGQYTSRIRPNNAEEIQNTTNIHAGGKMWSGAEFAYVFNLDFGSGGMCVHWAPIEWLVRKHAAKTRALVSVLFAEKVNPTELCWRYIRIRCHLGFDAVIYSVSTGVWISRGWGGGGSCHMTDALYIYLPKSCLLDKMPRSRTSTSMSSTMKWSPVLFLPKVNSSVFRVIVNLVHSEPLRGYREHPWRMKHCPGNILFNYPCHHLHRE